MKMYSASPTRKKSKRGASTVTKVCRTCLLDNKSNTSVFSLDIGLNINFCDIVTSVTGLQISRNDGFTEYICSLCKQNSKAAYLYKIQAQKTDEKLRSTTSIQENTEATEMRIAFSRLDDLLTDEKENEVKVKKELSDDGDDDYCCDDIFYDKQASALYESVESVENEFRQEVEEMEEPLALHRCEVCERKFETKSSLYSHLQTCIKVEDKAEKLNCCPVCEDMFDTEIELELHARSHDHLMTNDDGSKESAQSLDVSRSTYKNTRRVKKKKLSGKSLRQHKTKCDATSSTTPRQRNPNKQILLCCFCNKGFRKESSLAKHKMDMCVPQYVCDICHSRSKTKYALRKHLELHSVNSVEAPRKFPCTECKRVYSIERYLTVHILRHHRGEKPYKCTYCDKGFQKARPLRVHTRVHTGEKPYPCNVCGRKFARNNILERHMRTHTGERPYKCSYCDQAFRGRGDAVRHERHHTGAGAHVCLPCGAKFSLPQGLHNHQNNCAAMLSSRKKERCNICNKGVRSGTEPKCAKSSTVSLWFESMTCRTCLAILKHTNIHCYCYKRGISLFNHKMRRHNMEKKYECDICHKVSKTKSSLKMHISTHQPRRDLLCTECGHTFLDTTALTIHIRRKHTGEKPYKCKYCVKAFARCYDLQSHTRTHTGEKPYSCKVCGMKFARSCTMGVHMRTHTGEKPYKCSYCERTFRQSGDAAKHERSHTGAAAHACTACGDNFTKAKDLREHKTACKAKSSTITSSTDHRQQTRETVSSQQI